MAPAPTREPAIDHRAAKREADAAEAGLRQAEAAAGRAVGRVPM